jgi:hypothetical protein
VEEFNYLEKALTIKILFRKKLRVVRECLLSFSTELFVFQFTAQKLKIKLYRSIILPVMYECKTWSLILRVECKLRLCENRVLRSIFGHKRDEITGEWRKLHNEELNYLPLTQYCSGDQIEQNEMGRACSTYGERRGMYRVLVGKPEGRRPLGGTQV